MNDDDDILKPYRPRWGYTIGFKEVDGGLVFDWDSVELVERTYPGEDQLVKDYNRRTRLRRQVMNERPSR